MSTTDGSGATAPTAQEIADAIEILDMCKPIRDQQGSLWFGRNHNFADATFVDHGACQAFAIAAEALPHLVNRDSQFADMVGALEEAREYIGRENNPKSVGVLNKILAALHGIDLNNLPAIPTAGPST